MFSHKRHELGNMSLDDWVGRIFHRFRWCLLLCLSWVAVKELKLSHHNGEREREREREGEVCIYIYIYMYMYMSVYIHSRQYRFPNVVTEKKFLTSNPAGVYRVKC